jgi:hypothetical protein
MLSLSIIYTPRDNMYNYDKIIDEKEIQERLSRYHNNCSIIVYKYRENVTIDKVQYMKYENPKVYSGSAVTLLEIPKPMNCVLSPMFSDSHNLLFTSL